MSTMPRLVRADVATASKGIKEEMRRQAELYLAAQLQSGIAADQRAMSFVSLMAAAAVVVAGGGGTLILPPSQHLFIGWVCIAIASAFTLAMGAAIESAAPVDFHYSGGAPFDWKEDISSDMSFEDTLTDVLVHLDERIVVNNRVLKRNARWMWWAVRIAWGGLTIGGILAITGLFLH